MSTTLDRNKEWLKKQAENRRSKKYKTEHGTYSLPGELVGSGKMNPTGYCSMSKTLTRDSSPHGLGGGVDTLTYELKHDFVVPKGRGEKPHYTGKVIGRIGEVYNVNAWINERGEMRIEIIK